MAKRKIAPSVDRLKELLRYEPVTGKFFWREDRYPAKAGDEAGYTTKLGYWMIGLDHKVYLAHRLAWLYMTGEWPDEIDHRNLVKDDNRWDNLRKASRSENAAHCPPKVPGALGLRGVSLDRNRYRARITKDGKTIALGHFATKEEAKASYDAAAAKIYGEFVYAATVCIK